MTRVRTVLPSRPSALLPSCGQEYTTCPRLLLLLPILERPIDCIRRNPADHKKTPLMIFQLSVGNSLRRSPHDNTSDKPNWEHLKSHDRLSNDISATSAVHCGYSYKHPYVYNCRTVINKLIRKRVNKCFFCNYIRLLEQINCHRYCTMSET